jgi:hypothetical protein
MILKVAIILALKKGSGGGVSGAGEPIGSGEISHGFRGIKAGSLKGCREETGAPAIHARLGSATDIGNRDVSGKVLSFTAEGISCPSSGTGETIQSEAGAHEVFARSVGIGFPSHTVEKTHLISEITEPRKKIRDHLTALPPRLKFPRTFHQVPLFSLKGDEFVATWHGLAVAFDKLRFVIPGVDLADRSGTKNHQHLLGPRHSMRKPGGVWIGRIDRRPNGHFTGGALS